MHLERLQKAGLVVGELELSKDGKAMRYLELVPFELRLSIDTILGALNEGPDDTKKASP
jgi:hypothetical protein